jgi:hypothetical protein
VVLVHCSNPRTGTGDIVIDCGYTKCFTEMTADGTFRYIQNIAGWTGRPEVHRALDRGVEPCDWRPKAVIFTMQKGVKWGNFEKLPSQGYDVKNLRTLWAIDCSGSVHRDQLYHSELKKILDEYYKNGDEFWLWDDKIEQRNYSGICSFINNMEGRGGTESSLIADIAQRSSLREHLIIVTDGCVNGGAIDRSDQKMRNNRIQFQAVTTFIIGSGGDLSVGAPYSRGCPNQTFTIRSKGSREKITSLSSQDLEALKEIDRINTYQQFTSKYNSLDNAIQAKMLGSSGDSSLQSQLNSLQRRVINNGLNSSQQSDFNSKFNSLTNMARGGLRDTFTLDSIAAAKKQ